MKTNKFPKNWNEKRVRKVIAHYQKQTEEEAVNADEAPIKDSSQTVMTVPNELVPVVREMIKVYQNRLVTSH